MAHVYYTQEKYRFAEVYAGRALAINKGSSIAYTQLALVRRGLLATGRAFVGPVLSVELGRNLLRLENVLGWLNYSTELNYSTGLITALA